MTEMKHGECLVLMLILGATAPAALAQQPASPSYPVYKVTNSPAATPPSPAPAVTPAPPPAAPARRSAADLEKLVAPIALYPDPLIATILPASVYPLEIVQAARFVADTNNLARLDAQPWDANVKAVARVPEVIKKMNADLSWTMELGEAFLAQDKDLMDAIQTLRGKAQTVGTLKTSPQQVVIVTNVVVEKTIEQQVVVVTNTIVQIQPANPQVVYVPTYNPAVVYYPPPPTYVGPPPIVSFAAGVAVGAIIANNCDWHHGGCYHGDVNIDIDRNVNVNQNVNVNRNASANSARSSANATSASAPKKWQPDQSRLSKSGSPTAAASARSGEARGWSSAGASPATANTGARASSGAGGARPSTASTSARPPAATASASARPPSAASSASRPSASAGASPGASRPSPSPTAAASRPTPSSTGASSSASAFSGTSSGSDARSAGSRGASSRSSSAGGRSGGGRR